MDANVALSGVQQISSIQILEQINTFYKHAWDMLLIYITVSIFVVGVVVPVLIQWYQKKIFKLEEKKLREEIINEIKKDIELEFINERDGLKDMFNKYKYETEQELGFVKGVIFHSQAVLLKNQGHYLHSTRSVLDSVPSYCKCEKMVNFRRALELLNDCLKHVNGKEIATLEEEGYDIEKSLTSIEQYDSKGNLSDLLTQIKRSFKDARGRS